MKNNQIFSYFSSELSHFRKEGEKFSEKYPHIASKLSLSRDVSPDSDTERLIESVAFLTARIHRNIDNQFFDFVDLLLSMTMPEISKFVPPRTILKCDPTQISGNFPKKIGRNDVFEVNNKDYSHIKFTALYNTDIYPLNIDDTSYVPFSELPPVTSKGLIDGAIKIDISLIETAQLSSCSGNILRFFIDHDIQTAHFLYEIVHRSCNIWASFDIGNGDHEVVPLKLREVGFNDNETLFPSQSNPASPQLFAYEYFSFYEKFLFFDLEFPETLSKYDYRTLSIYITYEDTLPKGIQHRILSKLDKSSFVLNALPVINLFTKAAEPIRVNHRDHEYSIISDYRKESQNYFIHDIQDVTLIKQSPTGQFIQEVLPLYSSYPHLERAECFWVARKELTDTQPYNLYISLIGNDHLDDLHTEDVLSIKVRCCNDDDTIQSLYQMSHGQYDLSYEKEASLNIRFLKPPHCHIPPIQNPETLWKLVSHQNFNRQVFLSQKQSLIESLSQALHLYNPYSSHMAHEYERTNSFISGIYNINIYNEMRRFGSLNQQSFCKGNAINIVYDENKFTGGGVYLFSKILEHFINAYSSIHSYTRFNARSTQRKTDIAQWSAKAGKKPLI